MQRHFFRANGCMQVFQYQIHCLIALAIQMDIGKLFCCTPFTKRSILSRSMDVRDRIGVLLRYTFDVAECGIPLVCVSWK